MRFKTGQEVVSLGTYVNLVKDKTYVILDLRTCKCGSVVLDVGTDNGDMFHCICLCGNSVMGGQDWYKSSRFAPLEDIKEAEEAVNELIEELIIKKHQLN